MTVLSIAEIRKTFEQPAGLLCVDKDDFFSEPFNYDPVTKGFFRPGRKTKSVLKETRTFIRSDRDIEVLGLRGHPACCGAYWITSEKKQIHNFTNYGWRHFYNSMDLEVKLADYNGRYGRYLVLSHGRVEGMEHAIELRPGLWAYSELKKPAPLITKEIRGPELYCYYNEKAPDESYVSYNSFSQYRSDRYSALPTEEQDPTPAFCITNPTQDRSHYSVSLIEKGFRPYFSFTNCVHNHDITFWVRGDGWTELNFN